MLTIASVINDNIEYIFYVKNHIGKECIIIGLLIPFLIT